jgi:hypothetical protein
VHLSSFVLYGLATAHSVTAGSDIENRAFALVSVGSVQLVLFLTLIRLVAGRRARRAQRPVRVESTGQAPQKIAA